MSGKHLYQPCTIADECESHVCAMGFCTAACGNDLQRGKYKIGDCITEGVVCYEAGVGCCKLTSVEAKSVDQDRVYGQCIAAP